MNNELILFGAGMMLGAGTPIIFRQEYSTTHWVLNWVGVLLVLMGAIL